LRAARESGLVGAADSVRVPRDVLSGCFEQGGYTAAVRVEQLRDPIDRFVDPNPEIGRVTPAIGRS
jgi:hypothetical protein